MNDKLNNYNYMKMLCSKLSRNQIIEDLAIKCEELYLAREYSLKKDLKIEQLQSNWNSLREWLKEYSQDLEFRCYMDMVLDKMNKLEGKDNNGK